MDINKDLTIAALMESNEMLGDMLKRYRRVTAYLRKENSRLRKLKNIQHQNDLEFMAMCQADIVVEYHTPYNPEGVYHLPKHSGNKIVVDVTPTMGGLPVLGAS